MRGKGKLLDLMPKNIIPRVPEPRHTDVHWRRNANGAYAPYDMTVAATVHAKGTWNSQTDDNQKHFRCTMVGPDSSYSPLEIHICWKVLNEDKIEPPIHTEYLRSGGATTLIFMVLGAKAVISFVIRSPIPPNIVVPPDITTLAYKSLRISTSHFMIDWNVVSCMPLASLPMKLGWKRTSGQRKRSLPTVMMLPSGSSYVFFFVGAFARRLHLSVEIK